MRLKGGDQEATAATEMQARPKSEAFRFMLRRATRIEHKALDAHPAFAALMEGTLSVDGYRSLMALFHGFYQRHDPLLERACSLHALDRMGFVYASRSVLLRSDLAALDGGPSGPRTDKSAALPPIGSAGTLGGVLYVIEGSMLGGTVLCRAVEALLSQKGAEGCGYWRWCRDASAARWAMTCAMIERLAATETARAEMIAGAQAAFATFAGWLDSWKEDKHTGGACLGIFARC
jgi:heme oxygenase